MMLRVNPRVRPDCDKLLEFIGKYRNNQKSFQQRSQEKTSYNLLNTIKVPRGMVNLDSRLPQSNYIQTEPALPTPEIIKEEEIKLEDTKEDKENKIIEKSENKDKKGKV